MLPGKNIKAVIFDMDGVIVDNHDYHHEAWKNLLGSRAEIFEKEEIKKNER